MEEGKTLARQSHLRHVMVERDKAGRLQVADGIQTSDLGRAILDDEQLIIFRGAYSADEMVTLRRDVLAWGEEEGAWPQGVSAGREAINFHRVDDGKITGRMAHIFHQFGFGLPDEISEPLRGKLAGLRSDLADLQNRLAGTDFALDASEFRTKVIRHPRGGGYLVPHAHPFLPQKVAIFLNLSEPGEDYSSGSARFRRSDGEWVDTFDDFRCGDFLAWRYDMVHETTPVDPGAEVDWEGEDGLWIYAIEHVPAHENSNAVAGES